MATNKHYYSSTDHDCTPKQAKLIRNKDYMHFLSLERADTRFNYRMRDFSKGQRFIDITEKDLKSIYGFHIPLVS